MISCEKELSYLTIFDFTQTSLLNIYHLPGQVKTPKDRDHDEIFLCEARLKFYRTSKSSLHIQQSESIIKGTWAGWPINNWAIFMELRKETSNFSLKWAGEDVFGTKFQKIVLTEKRGDEEFLGKKEVKTFLEKKFPKLGQGFSQLQLVPFRNGFWRKIEHLQ